MALFAKPLLLCCTFLLVTLSHGEKKSFPDNLFIHDGWCYGENPECGESTWAGMCQTGTHQSPIDLPPLANLPEKEAFSIDKKSFNLDKYTIINNALAYRLVTVFQDKEPAFFVPYLNATYVYRSFHIHWGSDSSKGSEHSVQGKFYSGELHILLYKDTFRSLKDAVLVNENDAVLSMTFFLVDSPTSKVLAELADQVPLEPSISNSTRPVDLSGLFKGDKAWAYFGGGTVPPCIEDIAFLIFEEPVEVSQLFMTKLRQMKNPVGEAISNNFKSIVPIKDHQLYQVKIDYI